MASGQYENFLLEPKTIDHVAELVSETLAEYRMDQKEILRIRLSLENLLQCILDNSAASRICSFSISKRFGNRQIRLVYDGLPDNPLENEDDEYSRLLLQNLGVSCEWRYLNNSNILSLFLHKPRNGTLLPLLAAISAAVILGFFSRWIPESVKTNVSTYFLMPFRNAYLGLLSAMASILIFCNIITGLCGNKDSEPLSGNSKRMFLRMPLVLTAITAVGYLLLLLLSNVDFHGKAVETESQLGQVIELLWGLVPNGIVTPFLGPNFVHIVVLAFLFGMILSAQRDQHPELIATMNSLNSVIMTATSRICRLVPVFVFCSLLNLILASSASAMLSDIWKPVVWFLLVSIVLIVIVLIWTSIRMHCSCLKLLNAILPPVLICLTTASPITAYSANLEILENRFGVSKRFSRVGLSISSKMYGPGCVLYLAVMVIYFAEKYGVSVNLGWLLTAILMTVLLTFACPPIPGGMLIIFGVLGKQFGFPDECIVILATADVVLDGLSGAVSCALRNAELLLEARQYGELDTKMIQQL